MKPLGKIEIKWSPNFAYAIGLLVSDGSLSKDKRHIIFTSKEREQIDNFQKSLGTCYLVSKIASGRSEDSGEKRYLRIQMGDVLFYKFLLSIGLMPNKTKIIKSINVPDEYFFDFLRGHFDGDGSFYSFWDKRWRSSFMFYTVFVSASKEHIEWLRGQIFKFLKVGGSIYKSRDRVCYQLKYAKGDSKKIIDRMYYSDNLICLSRKRLKINKALSIMSKL